MSGRDSLETLARLHDIDISYHDVNGHLNVASDETLVYVLRCLGADAGDGDQVEAALAARRIALAERVLEPVLVVWEGEPPVFVIRVPQSRLAARYRIDTHLEQGTSLGIEGELSTLRPVERFEVDGRVFVDLEVRLPERLPFGYHRVAAEIDGGLHEAVLLAAPQRAHPGEVDRMWGVFAPTYALHGARTMGAGGLAELTRMTRITQEAGGHLVGTLPLMAAFLDEPFQPSPYVPVSKLFFNELFLDLHGLAHEQGSDAARIALADPDLLDEAARLRAMPYVDYHAQARLHRTVLEILAREAFEEGSITRAALESYAAQHPRVADYARFRAVTEQHRAPWQTWPERQRSGRIEAGDYDESSFRYHLYAQWRLEEQLRRLGDEARAGGGGLYLDMPLGVHPDGYDAWRERDVFLDGLNAGAPPDALGPDGQDWGFRPLHPERIRATGYRYLIDCIRAQIRNAGILRIDHVMGLHRIFCVPWSMGGAHGAYVRYRPEEIWAIITLESRRHGAMIVGEDLGTVPNEVREAMDRHDIQRMFVLQFEMDPVRERAIRPVPPNAVASINTHDTPTFGGYWEDRDIDDRVALGSLDAGAAHWHKEERGRVKGALCGFLEDRGLIGPHPSPEVIYRAACRYLAQSSCRVVLLNLEDLWLEPEPQNVPGTSDERPNWRRKLGVTLEAVVDHEEVKQTLSTVARERRREAEGT